MAEYIERGAVRMAMDYIKDNYGADFTELNDIVSKLPAANVRENVKAYWIPTSHFGEFIDDGNGVFRAPLIAAGFKCSACGVEKYARTKWCPDCGADMTGGNDG